jgi:uncharacterized membrane protein
LLTGDILIGSLVALVEPCINTVAFYFHELFWNKKENNKNKKSGSKATLLFN